MVAAGCSNPLGKAMVPTLKPLTQLAEVNYTLDLTEELKHLLQQHAAGFPELKCFDLSDSLKPAQVQGFQLEQQVLFSLKLNLDLAHTCSKYFDTHQEEYPLWHQKALSDDGAFSTSQRAGRSV